MSSFVDISKVWGKMYKKWSYVVLTFGVAFVFVFLNGFILNTENIFAFSYLSTLDYLGFIFSVSLGFFNQVNWLTYAGTIFLGILIGMFVSLLAFRFSTVDRESMKGVGFLGGLGIFLGAAAPGCGACGVGILSLLGLSPILTVLPFHGNEILVLAVAFTGYSVYRISGKISNPSCKIDLNSNIERRSKK
jgi:hypothetical protein